MTPPPNRWNLLVGAAIFLFALLFLYRVAAGVLQTAGDEGIYLEGGHRIAAGQQPYRDFFVLTGPLTFWIEGALARAGSLHLAVMRLSMILDCAFLAWAVYWFTSRHASILYSAGAAIAFLAYESRLRLLNVNHRWDSAALATAAIVAAWASVPADRPLYWAFSGMLVAAAALATPSMLLLALPLLWWSFRRAAAPAYISGGAAVAAAAAVYLQAHGALLPMLESLRWTGANYMAANRVLYGSVWLGADSAGLHITGWNYLFASAAAILPAVLPIAAIAGWVWRRSSGKQPSDLLEIAPLLAAAAALVFSAWPRWTADALLHTMALSWALCALLVYRLTAPRQRSWFCALVLLVSAYSLVSKSWAAADDWPVETRVGDLRAAPAESEFLAALEHWVQPGDSLFSFPYLPSLYYFLDSRNPSRYSFLQPGMMTAADERRAVAELRADPPRWVIFEDYPPAAVLSIWPGSNPALIPMAAMNAYLRENYRPVDSVTGPWSRVAVMQRITPPAP